jgi:uncharacterized protein
VTGLESRIHVITLGVGDLERSLDFYRALGLDSEGVIGTQYLGDDTNPGGAAAMFHLENDLTLALYGRDDLAKDARIPVPPPGSGEFSIGHIVSSKGEVDDLLARAEAAGATITAEPGERPWGIYSGYFRDPDGHLWEIICRMRG